MKRYLKNFFALAAALFVLVACDEDAELTVLQPVSFTAAPAVSASSVALSQETEAEPALTISWPEVTYPVQAPVTYSIQFALPADTLGATAWSNSVTVEAGADVLSKSFLGKDLNQLAKNLGLEPDEEGTMVMRVQSYLDRPAFSKAVAISVTPYTAVIEYANALWVAGDFQGWNIGAAPKLVSMNDDGIYEGYIYIPAGGSNEFKLYAQPNWEPMSYGDGGNGTVIVANYSGGNFKAPSDGYYLVTVNLNTMTYMLMKTTWGIIGGATPGGWDADTPLTYDPATQTWKVTADMKADGSFKFRANNAWLLDFGVDANGKIAYANHPLLPYVDQPQFSVPSDGNYTITLDLHESGNYTYQIRKN